MKTTCVARTLRRVLRERTPPDLVPAALRRRARSGTLPSTCGVPGCTERAETFQLDPDYGVLARCWRHLERTAEAVWLPDVERAVRTS